MWQELRASSTKRGAHGVQGLQSECLEPPRCPPARGPLPVDTETHTGLCSGPDSRFSCSERLLDGLGPWSGVTRPLPTCPAGCKALVETTQCDKIGSLDFQLYGTPTPRADPAQMQQQPRRPHEAPKSPLLPLAEPLVHEATWPPRDGAGDVQDGGLCRGPEGSQKPVFQEEAAAASGAGCHMWPWP